MFYTFKYKNLLFGIEAIFMIPMFLWTWLLTIVYCRRVFVAKRRNMTNDQKMIVDQLLVWSLCRPILFYIVSFQDRILQDRRNVSLHTSFRLKTIVVHITVLQTSIGMCIIFMLIIWIRAHHFRRLKMAHASFAEIDSLLTPSDDTYFHACYVPHNQRVFSFSKH